MNRDITIAVLVLVLAALAYRLGANEGYEMGYNDALFDEMEYICGLEET